MQNLGEVEIFLSSLYEHTTQTKNIADRSFAVSTRQWRHNAIVARSHYEYGSAPNMQCGFLYATEFILAETGKQLRAKTEEMYSSGKNSVLLVMHNEK
jgi:hypothetical protein